MISELIYRNPPMRAERVLETVAAMEQAGIRTAIMGGWGVDALQGRQQLRHHDLDLLADHRQFDAALAVLESLGFERWNRTYSPAPLGDFTLYATETLRDSALRVVDLHGTVLDDEGPELASGTIAGNRVPCMTPQQQIDAQTGRVWTWGRLQRRRAMYATVTALIASSAAAEIGGEGSEARGEGSAPAGIARADPLPPKGSDC